MCFALCMYIEECQVGNLMIEVFKQLMKITENVKFDLYGVIKSSQWPIIILNQFQIQKWD